MIDSHADSNSKICFPENFTGLGKLKDYQVKLHVDTGVKPIIVPPWSTPYHLQERVQ